MAILRPALLILLFLTLITGGAYPLLTTALGQWWFHDRANGSLIYADGQPRGSRLIGQSFTSAKYFHGRPSATADSSYNPLASGGSNLAASNPALDEAVRARVVQLRKENPQATGPVPLALVTASASGLDSDLPPQAVRWQIQRVAAARGIPAATLEALVAEYIEHPPVGFIGQPVVNIAALNQALDALKQP